MPPAESTARPRPPAPCRPVRRGGQPLRLPAPRARTKIALTKLDILDSLDEIPVTVAYELDGREIHDFPYGDVLEQAKPVNKMFKGWRTDISGCRKKEELPREALEYIAFIEEAVGVKIKYVSVGAERDQYIVL